MHESYFSLRQMSGRNLKETMTSSSRQLSVNKTNTRSVSKDKELSFNELGRKGGREGTSLKLKAEPQLVEARNTAWTATAENFIKFLCRRRKNVHPDKVFLELSSLVAELSVFMKKERRIQD